MLRFTKQRCEAAVDNATKTNECYAYFYVAGPFHPAEITEKVGLNPTRCWLAGDPVDDRTKRVHEHSRWQLDSRLEKTATLEEHVSDVLAQLDAKKDEFKLISIELGGIMQLVEYFYEINPGLNFHRDVIKRVAEYSLSIDCDFYCLAGDDGSRRPN